VPVYNTHSRGSHRPLSHSTALHTHAHAYCALRVCSNAQIAPPSLLPAANLLRNCWWGRTAIFLDCCDCLYQFLKTFVRERLNCQCSLDYPRVMCPECNYSEEKVTTLNVQFKTFTRRNNITSYRILIDFCARCTVPTFMWLLD
jgi:hypothetical protein